MTTVITPKRNAVERAMRRAAWQPDLFGDPDRARLLEWASLGPARRLRVRVHRNHAIEPVTSAIGPWTDWNGYSIEWHIGTYDDSLSFNDVGGDADVELVWLDTGRLQRAEDALVKRWLPDRIGALRAATSSPIIVAAWPLRNVVGEALRRIPAPAIHVCDLEALAESLGERWLDLRAQSISGTRLSNRACLEVARALACKWIPACVLPPMKCVVVDLDGTLYDGVLAEDGFDGIEVLTGHRKLQATLAHFRQRGILLAIATRNERTDVEALFARRPDFELSLEDFSVIEASWKDKPAMLTHIARQLRIGADTIICIDDNPGELAEIAAGTPVVTVHAAKDGEGSAAALEHVAGLFRWTTSAEDRVRAIDLRAAEERDLRLASAASHESYWRDLDVHLHYRVGQPATSARIGELLAKTTQFNLALGRIPEVEIIGRMRDDPQRVITIALADRLSDSGIIAAIIAACEGPVLRVDALVVSCRALGRGLEATMIATGLRLMTAGRIFDRIAFAVSEGPRNAPAREWLAAFGGAAVPEGARSVSISPQRVAEVRVSDAIRITVAGASHPAVATS
jgi:FkbH-like protein